MGFGKKSSYSNNSVGTDFNFLLTEQLKNLGERGTWMLELNKVSWSEREPKLDIRPWDETHEKCGKGITLSDEEAQELMFGLMEYFGYETPREGSEEFIDADED